jgi:RNA polymerase sigma factor (sigma-70 family)
MAVSPKTQPSLLVRVRDHRDAESWSQFVEMYAPLVYGFLRKRGLQDADAADLTQDVMGNVAAAVSKFEYDPKRGSFRKWLFTVALNRLRNFQRSGSRKAAGSGDTQVHRLLSEQPDPKNGEADEWNQDYERRLFQHAADRVRIHFQDSTWQAFWQTAVEGRKAGDVSAGLGLSVAAVHLAKGRVIGRIKQEIAHLQGEVEWE